MPSTEDDFGFGSPRKSKRAQGVCTPRNAIGATVADVIDEHSPRPRDPPQARSILEYGSLLVPEADLDRRLRKAIFDDQGQAVSSQMPSPGNTRPCGIRMIEPINSHTKGPQDGAKRTFDFAYSRQTGHHNPMQYEDPAQPGVRPSHPVCAVGVVSQGHRRCYPDREYVETAIPPLKMGKAPHGASWGGWAKGGAPGRQPLVQPWEVAAESPKDDTFRVSDARRMKYPEMGYNYTGHLTSWHTDPQKDAEPAFRKKVHHSQAMSSAGSQVLRQPMAGKPSGIPVEGAALPFYDIVRAVEQEALNNTTMLSPR